jgi:Holliday junction resolvasome RuvABC endonuclease subunit
MCGPTFWRFDVKVSKAITHIAVSIDPGVNTGVVVWADKRPTAMVCITPPKGVKGVDRLLTLEEKLHNFMTEVVGRPLKASIRMVAIERPHQWTKRLAMKGVITLAQFQTIPIRYFRVCGVPVMEVFRDAKLERGLCGRGPAKGKLNAQFVCESLGVKTPNEHLTDAVYIGFLAGFTA